VAARRASSGVNVGANKDSVDRAGDYATCIAALAGRCAFITINVSSPNTPGLRGLQGKEALDDLVARAVAARDAAAAGGGRRTPLLLKIAPDLSLAELDDVVAWSWRAHRRLVVSNTTVARPSALKEAELARQVGGLSGRPLFRAVERLLAATYLRVERRLPLIGVAASIAGGRLDEIKAGATLLQLYSALVFKGPALIARSSAASSRASPRARASLAGLVDRRSRAEIIPTSGLPPLRGR